MIRKTIVCLLLVLAALPLYAGENVWTPVGPDSGGSVTGIAVHPTDPRVVYAGTDGGGVFKSTDGGRSWRAANQGLASLFIRGLVINPLNPKILYASTTGLQLSSSVIAGVFESTDGGVTWRDKSEGLPGGPRSCLCARLPVEALVMDARDPRILFAVVDGAIYRMNARGLRWIGFPGPGPRVLSLAGDAAGTLYAGTERGVFKKPLGGAWVSATAGLGERHVRILAVHPTNPLILYAGAGGSVYKSVDAGASWRHANQGIPGPEVLALEIDPRQPSIVYAGTHTGLFRSVGARRWVRTDAGIPPGPFRVVAVAPSDSDVLYAGTGVIHSSGYSGPGVFKSENGGASWQVQRRGINAGIVTSLAASRTLPRALYAGTDSQGVFRTDNGGGSWLHASNGLTDLGVLALAVDPTDSRTVYAGTRTGVFKTTNGGVSWTLRNQGLPPAAIFSGAEIRALAIDPEHPTTVFASTWRSVFRSTDGAATWQRVFIPPDGLDEIHALAAGPGGKVYLGGRSRDFLFDELFWASTDGGDTWQAPATVTGGVSELQVGPDGDIYAVIGWAIYRSSDGGANWVYIASSQEAVAMAVDPADPGLVYSGSRFLGVYVWTGEAETSGYLNTGLANHLVTTLATDPLSPGTVYVAVYGGGVYRLDRR